MQTIKHISFFYAFCSVLILCTTNALAQTTSYSVKTIVIDAGHGGKDPGACGKISKEKDLTLSLALKVGSLIVGGCPDVKVIYTRKTDEFIELHKRAEIANKANADLFLSIHVNASTNSEAFGADTWTMGLAKNEANLTVAKMENNVISLESDASQYKGMSANDNEAIILHKLQQGAFCDNSLALAGMIQFEMQNIGRKDRSVHQAPFLVLWKTAMPSVLIETGFISNAEEEKWLNVQENQAELAYTIYQAFLNYKKYIENRSNGHIQKELTPETPQLEPKQEKAQTQSELKPQPKATIEEPKQNKEVSQPQKDTFDIFYGIQIGAGKDKMELIPANFNGLSNVYYIEEGGLYKYYYGKTGTYKEISVLLQSVKGKYPSAYIVARNKENKKLELTEARKKTN